MRAQEKVRAMYHPHRCPRGREVTVVVEEEDRGAGDAEGGVDSGVGDEEGGGEGVGDGRFNRKDPGTGGRRSEGENWGRIG